LVLVAPGRQADPKGRVGEVRRHHLLRASAGRPQTSCRLIGTNPRNGQLSPSGRQFTRKLPVGAQSTITLVGRWGGCYHSAGRQHASNQRVIAIQVAVQDSSTIARVDIHATRRKSRRRLVFNRGTCEAYPPREAPSRSMTCAPGISPAKGSRLGCAAESSRL